MVIGLERGVAMKNIIVALALVACFCSESFAVDENSLNELASNSSMCAAYYMVVEECFKGDDHIETKKKISGLCDEMLMASIIFSNQETAQSRLNLFKKQLYGEVENSCGNISRIIEKYGDGCVLLSKAFRDKK